MGAPAIPGTKGGEELRRVRREAGLTQVQLAERIGIDQSRISRSETNRLQPEVAYLVENDLGLEPYTLLKYVRETTDGNTDAYLRLAAAA